MTHYPHPTRTRTPGCEGCCSAPPAPAWPARRQPGGANPASPQACDECNWLLFKMHYDNDRRKQQRTLLPARQVQRLSEAMFGYSGGLLGQRKLMGLAAAAAGTGGLYAKSDWVWRVIRCGCRTGRRCLAAGRLACWRCCRAVQLLAGAWPLLMMRCCTYLLHTCFPVSQHPMHTPACVCPLPRRRTFPLLQGEVSEGDSDSDDATDDDSDSDESNLSQPSEHSDEYEDEEEHGSSEDDQ